ncbi:hypothetical protein DPMN_022638 [Dreissena polymorpha]|uniref:Uncharacterized protein n=1 Tax=Dreissena polymorpha TaxID=45954 RepID=A0A9D4SBV2_DREPO|nr:hypothetical protein DPMN_022638 [Dreissena polymorpha]
MLLLILKYPGPLNDGTETHAGTWRMRDPSEHTRLPSFVALAHILQEISSTLAPIRGLRGPIHGPASEHSATISPEKMAQRRVLELGACMTHRDTQVCQVSSL